MAKIRVNWGAHSEGSVKLFEVYNTSNNGLYVLASDQLEAMSVAYTANHVYDPTPKIALNYSRLVHEVRSPISRELRRHWGSIQLAIAQRMRGTLHLEEGETFVGHEAIAKMILGRLNHVGIATPSIDESIAFYRDVMGATLIRAPFDMPAQGVRVCFVETPGVDGAPGTQIELLEPLGADSPVAGFLAKNPQGGQHHLCYEVPDITEARAWFEAQGKRILGETRIGAHGVPVFFVHPKDMMGVLTEIMEAPNGASQGDKH